MPVYDPQHVEYTIVNGRVSIVTDDGAQIPAYWSHPDLGGKFPAIAIIHDWWGITTARALDGAPVRAVGLLRDRPRPVRRRGRATRRKRRWRSSARQGARSYGCVDTALQVIEITCAPTATTAAVGLGMGGSLVFEAALERRRPGSGGRFLRLSAALFRQIQGREHADPRRSTAAPNRYVAASVIERLRA